MRATTLRMLFSSRAYNTISHTLLNLIPRGIVSIHDLGPLVYESLLEDLVWCALRLSSDAAQHQFRPIHATFGSGVLTVQHTIARTTTR